MPTPASDLLMPARMVNEYAFCPRLFHIEYVDGLFEDNIHTVEGRSVHRRVDAGEGDLPDPADPDAPKVARSVTLSSETLGAIAKIDLMEVEGAAAVPVDTKKGKVAPVPEGAWEPERVQLCVQGLLLREHGFACDHGFLWCAGSRTRVRVDFTPELEARTRELIAAARAAAEATTAPPPLVDSPKCAGCSLAGVCLPDEVNYLRHAQADAPRRLLVPRDDRVGVHVQGYGARIGKRGECLKITDRAGEEREVRLAEIEHLAIYGSNQITTQAIQALAGADIPVSFFSTGGWFYGTLRGHGLPNVNLRLEQFRKADDPVASLSIARGIVAGKIANCRTLLMRNHPQPPDDVVEGLRRHIELAGEAASAETLLGIEGNAARLYFGCFGGMLKSRAALPGDGFEFASRNRRPPRDPVNSMLSFAYALLVREAVSALLAVGFDPYVGFYHRPRPGRPALALDLMEEFRPLIADSVVLTAVNNGEVAPGQFTVTKAGCAMQEDLRRRFIELFEARLDTLVTHPVFDYRASYRRVMELQARLLGRVLTGEIEHYPAFTTR